MATNQEPNRDAAPATLPDLIVVREPESEGAQAYRSVRETLRHAHHDSPIRSVLLADAGSDGHAGEAAANITASFALNGDLSVLIELDAANPVIHQLLNTPAHPGLVDWLSSGKRSPAESAPTVHATGIANLGVVPVGGGDSGTARVPLADSLTDSSCQQLIQQLSATSQYVVFHGTVAPVTSQALTVAAQVDAVVLLVRSGTTRRTDAQRAKESLQRVGANLLGVVLTDG